MAKNKLHYVDNEKFYEAISEWKEKVLIARENGEIDPPVTEYIGECFLKICDGVAHRPNFMNYSFRDDLISDGLESCILYGHNFEPSKSKNPFAYFTQIIFSAYVRRITKEQKQSFIKYKVIEHEGVMNKAASFQTEDESDKKVITSYIDYLQSHEKYGDYLLKKKKVESKRKKNSTLGDFL